MGHGQEGKAERSGRKELRELWSLTKRWTPQGVEVGWGEGLMQQAAGGLRVSLYGQMKALR